MADTLDTIVVSIKEQDDKILRKSKKWFGVRIAKRKIDELKYIAFYQTAPLCRILYYPKLSKQPVIKDFENNKYEFYFNNSITELKTPIVRNKTDKDIILRTRRYTTIKKLLNKNNRYLKDLF